MAMNGPWRLFLGVMITGVVSSAIGCPVNTYTLSERFGGGGAIPSTGGNGETTSSTSTMGMGGAGGSRPCEPGSTCAVDTICDMNGVCGGCTTDVECHVGQTPSCDMETHLCNSCTDEKQNGDETAIDCGGTCPRCNGAACGTPKDCHSEVCADGFCCDKDCSTSCNTCAVPGKEGACAPVTKGLEDVGCMGPVNACDGDGACADPAPKKKAGELCSNDSECYTGVCNGICRLPDLAPCAENAECASLRCVAKVCTGCSVSTDCVSKNCSTATGRCLIPDGGICSNDSDCAGAACEDSRNHCGLSLGKQCANGSDCSTNHCDTAMGVCVTCTMATQAADCAGQTCDSVGSCRLSAGAPCTMDGQCTSNKCSTTFPAKCH